MEMRAGELRSTGRRSTDVVNVPCNKYYYTRAELAEFTDSLTTRNWRDMTSLDKRRISEFLESDGCSMVLDFYKRCCIFHDWWYATHLDFDLSDISRAEADKRFRHCIQSRSMLRKFSPMSWWRWLGVRTWGGRPWANERNGVSE